MDRESKIDALMNAFSQVDVATYYERPINFRALAEQVLDTIDPNS